MNLSPNNKDHQKRVSPWVAGLVVFCIMAISLESFAAKAPPGTPKKNDCKDQWTLTDLTPGMKFGDFTIESGTGTITLNGGLSRTSGGTVNLVSAGSVVSSHQISITNALDVRCAWYGISILWVTDPTTTPMQLAGGSDITMSNVLVDIPGETGTPFAIAALPYAFTPLSSSLPIVVEITSQMTANSPQTGGAYSSAIYVLGVEQSNTTNSGPSAGVADTFSIIPIALTPGADMDFGTIVAGSNATTVSVDAAGAVTAPAGTGNAVVIVATGAALTYDVQAATGLTYNVNIANGSLDDGAGGAAMAVTIIGNDDPGVGTGGPVTVKVWADLSVGANQAGGNYSTTLGTPIVISVNYN